MPHDAAAPVQRHAAWKGARQHGLVGRIKVNQLRRRCCMSFGGVIVCRIHLAQLGVDRMPLALADRARTRMPLILMQLALHALLLALNERTPLLSR